MEKAEKSSRLGCFAGIFSSGDEKERAQRLQQLRTPSPGEAK
jgi:hypothetical protein